LRCVKKTNLSQIEGHNGILVNNSFKTLEKVLSEYRVSQPYLNQVQRLDLSKWPKITKKFQVLRGISLQECVSPKPKTLES